MGTVILGWAALIALLIGVAGTGVGGWWANFPIDSDHETAGKMLLLLSVMPLGAGGLLGLIWLAVA